jgi:hypothetical protein
MKLSIVRTDECHLDVFTNLAEASAFVKEQSDYSTAAVLGTYAVPGSPDSRPVWIVIFGDRGFISGCRGAFLNEDRAVAVAASLEARCEMGFSFSAVKFVLDRPARSDAVGGAKYCRAPCEDQPGHRAPRDDQPRTRAASSESDADSGSLSGDSESSWSENDKSERSRGPARAAEAGKGESIKKQRLSKAARADDGTNQKLSSLFGKLGSKASAAPSQMGNTGTHASVATHSSVDSGEADSPNGKNSRQYTMLRKRSACHYCSEIGQNCGLVAGKCPNRPCKTCQGRHRHGRCRLKKPLAPVVPALAPAQPAK